MELIWTPDCLGRVQTGLSQAGGLQPPQFLTDELTLSQPGGHIIHTQYYTSPPPLDFQTLRRPCQTANHYTIGNICEMMWNVDDKSKIVLQEVHRRKQYLPPPESLWIWY